MTPSRKWWSTDPITPMVSGLVQVIRFDGPVARYRVASRQLCRMASVLGWAAVVIGAGEIALGAVLFSNWRREGGWWAGLIGAVLGMAATGITADVPVGTPLVTWLLGLSLLSLLLSLATLVALDGARWLDTKSVEVCIKSFDDVCQNFDCTCSASDDAWNICFSPGNGDCNAIETAPPLLLASSCALFALSVISVLLLAVAIKIKYLGGGVTVEREVMRSNPLKTPSRDCFPEPPQLRNKQHQIRHNDQHEHQERGQQPPRSTGEAGRVVRAEYKEAHNEEGVAARKEVLTGAEPWAVGYVDRYAGGGNKKRRDELNGVERGGRGGGDGDGGGGFDSGGTRIVSPCGGDRTHLSQGKAIAMLTGTAGCSQPQSIEQARQDFKIYMSRLLADGAALDAFRPDARCGDVGDAGSGGPAWGPPLRRLSEGGGSVGGTKGSPAASVAHHTPSTSLSPSYFREEHAWPRAGAVTPPRPRPPLNFSWVAEPPTLEVGVREGSGVATGRPLFSDSAPSLATPSEGGRRPSDENAMATGGLGGAEGVDEWKAQWSRRLLRGPMHSEYQARFPWPPRSALKAASAVHAPSASAHHRGRSAASASNTAETRAHRSTVMTSPSPQVRSISPLRRRGRGRGRSRADGGSTSGARQEGGLQDLGARGASEPPRGRRTAVGADSLTGIRRNYLRSPSSVDAAVQQGGGEHANGNETATGRKVESFVEGTAVAAPAGAVPSVGEERHVDGRQEQRVGDVPGESPALSDELGSGTRCSDSDGQEEAGGRDAVGYDPDLPSKAAETFGSPLAKANVVERATRDAAGGEAWREPTVGRGGTTMTSGGLTLDYTCQSILTEYMDEFAWPSTLPVPGKRGKRTGMGVDHVGRLLAGKRAEEPRRALDPGVVVRLGAAADGALRACSPGHLSEMCRLKSPSPACRRLVLGLVIALGLRWRRWSDIRSRLLGSKSELVGFLKTFDKNRSGLTSATLRPFVDDPSLSPAQVRRVAACMVWVSRWLRALYKYLAAKEGDANLELDLDLDVDIGTASLLQRPAAAGLPDRASRQLHQSSHSRTHEPASGSALEKFEKGSERRGRPNGAGVAGYQRIQEAAKRPPSAAKEARAEAQIERHHANTDDDESRDTRTKRRSSHAAAAQGDGSSCPLMSTATGGDVEAASRVHGARSGKRGEDEAAAVSFVGSSGGGLNSESQWTAGTVTSRGDVLGAPTDDQVDIGSGVEARRDDDNAPTVRRRHNYGAGASSSVGRPSPVGEASSRVAGTTMSLNKALQGERENSRRQMSRGSQASHGCIYRHKLKARTPSRIANPKARRPTRALSVLDGEVNRNWHLKDSNGEKHLLSLFHDCVTGARAAMLDYEEVPGSAGTTNVFNLVAGRVDIPFSMRKGSTRALDNGCLTIVRRGLTGFSYECEVNGKLVLDTTSVVQNTEYEYDVSMPATVDTGSTLSGVTWYEVHTMRKADSKGTLVHRRFRDFNALHEQVESLMKGHHLRSSLPRFPGKKSKLWTNHGDVGFVEDRRRALEQYLKTLLQLPHVSTLDSTRAFLGMVGNLREFSVPWDGKELGVTLKRASEVAGGILAGAGGSAGESGRAGAPPVITSVKGKGKSPPGVYPGDRLFKVNGDSTELMSLEAAWSSVARATRPVMLHFLGPILRMDSTLTPLPEAFLRRRTSLGKCEPSGDGGLKGNSKSTGAAGPDGSQWSLRVMWPAWKQQEAAKNGEGRGPAVGTVGPFGNGAGAAGSGRSLPPNSRLFGRSAGGDRDGSAARPKDSSFESGRAQEGVGLGSGRAARLPGNKLRDGGGGGVQGSRESSEWVPDFSRGSAGLANSAGPAGRRNSEELRASGDFSAGLTARF
eukprot:g8812.t1